MTKELTSLLRNVAKVDNPNLPSLLSDKVHVSFLLDKSSSMQSLKQETIRAFNDYLNELRPNAKILCSLHQFPGSYYDGDRYKTIYSQQPAATAFELSDENFQPNGGTPLFRSITELLTNLYRENPLGRHVVVILTDGEDTGGGAELAKELIRKRREDGWQILFLGADIDVSRMARLMGIDPMQTLSYNARSYSSETFKALAGSINDYADEEAHEEIDLSDLKRISNGGK